MGLATVSCLTYPDDYQFGYKHWLLEAIGDILPPEITKRPKRGFTPPTTLWITEVVLSNREKLFEGFLVKQGILEKKYILETLHDIRSNSDFLYKPLVLETWISKYLPIS